MKTKALRELQSVMPAVRRGVASWHESLNQDDAATFAEIKRAFQSGEIAEGKWTVARAVRAMLANRQITVKEAAIVRWLENQT